MAYTTLNPTQTEIDAVEEMVARQGLTFEEVEPLAGDVSSRHYYRTRLANDGRSVVIAVYPEDSRESCERFHRTTELLTVAGVRVPEIIGLDCEEGWMVVEDLGSDNLYQRFREADDPWAELTPYYRDALESIRRISRLPTNELVEVNPMLDMPLLHWEIRLFWKAFLLPSKMLPEAEVRHRLWRTLEELVTEIGRQPKAPCHRDFMARNLVPLGGGDGSAAVHLGVLDHQDLRLGPPFYDLASFLNDSLFPPQELEDELAESFLHSEEDHHTYHRIAAQRSLKAVGTYARFGSEFHRRLIMPTLHRALSHMERVPELAGWSQELGARADARPDLLEFET